MNPKCNSAWMNSNISALKYILQQWLLHQCRHWMSETYTPISIYCTWKNVTEFDIPHCRLSPIIVSGNYRSFFHIILYTYLLTQIRNVRKTILGEALMYYSWPRKTPDTKFLFRFNKVELALIPPSLLCLFRGVVVSVRVNHLRC